jgi:RNA polymerase sigma factor (sigma-70 family)
MSDWQRDYDRIVGPLEDRMIRSIWRIVGNTQDAEDAMQNALLVIWKRWGRVTSHPSPEALILKICIDAAYDVTRRRICEQNGRGSHCPTDEPADPMRSSAEQLIQAEVYSEVVAAIQRLSRQQAAAILMRVLGELTYNQIAAAMGCTEATVRKHVARARERLREMLPHLVPKNTMLS